MHLYELPQSVRRLEYLLDESEGEVTPEIDALMAEIDRESGSKTDYFCGLIAELKAQGEAEKEEAKRLSMRGQVSLNKADRIKEYLFKAMQAMDVEKLIGKHFTATICNNSVPTIRWIGDSDPPKQFQRVKIELDGDKAREAWKLNKLPKGFFAQVGKHLRIK